MNIQQLIKLSRPRFWLYLAGPYLLGVIYAFNALPNPTLAFLYGLLYFLLPANIYLYGINDLFDGDTDQYNVQKKGKKEVLLKQNQKKKLITILTLTVLLSIPLFFYGSWQANLFLLGYLILATIYSAPPRLKARPILDFSSNILYIMPGFFSYTWITGNFPKIEFIAAFFFWTAAMHLYSAIPDIAADRKAKVTTTAVALGKETSLILCGFFWLMFTSILATELFPFGSIGIIYVIMIFISWIKKDKIDKIYWYFPYINGILGFLGFLYGVL